MTSGISKKAHFAAYIQPAQIDDAPAVYELLYEAFGDRYIKFSIYQSPLAVNYLREQIGLGVRNGSPTVFVARNSDSLLGFYLAVRREEELFLGYIATNRSARGSGIGRLMLSHFEISALQMGCARTGLEVFESNGSAVAWYERAGYIQNRKNYHTIIDLGALPSGHAPRLILDSGELKHALLLEEKLGFSKIPCLVDGGSVLLGVIAGCICNLLESKGISVLDAARAIVRSPLSARRWLLVTTAEPLHDIVGIDSSETSLYMIRSAG
jgi:ribosomal protein S18 acetylase RimI-like enzyme